MADPSPATRQPKLSVASTRKHLRRDQAAARKARSHSTMPGDLLKERQQKLKEEREAKRASMDSRHQHLFSAIAAKLGMEESQVEDLVLEREQISVIDDFFTQNGSRCLLFYYEETPAPSDTKGSKVTKRLYVTDGTKEAFPGLGMFFLRITNKPITTANVAQEVFFGVLESNGGGLLGAIESLLVQVFIPALQQQTNWGTLSSDANGHILKEAFLGKLSQFVSMLSNARASIADTVTLSACPHPQLAAISSPSEILAAAGNSELVEAAEACTQTWCREIEQILTQSEQMRREADDVGPRAELQHWKKRMAKFDSLTACVKSPQYRAVINVLVAAKSKVLEVWKKLDMSITDFTNEAKDNVKFLYTLEKYCEPLYKCNPVTMLDTIPGLMNAIRMLNSYSRYYNTSERMTALFVKVTNQMITACRAHITESGFYKIWDQERAVVQRKLADCIRLNQEYQLCFQRTKERLQDHPEERPFDFSEMYIFGKFNNFCRRLENINQFLQATGTYETLELSKIEGIETYNARFGLLVSNMKKKAYDPLDHRKPDFDIDFSDFKQQLADLEAQLQGFMDNFFQNAKTVQRAVEFTQRFERLQLPCLDILAKWKYAVSLFVKDMQFVQSEYNEHKHDPPLARNLPPVSGKIAWSRQLYRHLSMPMAAFQRVPELMQLPETKKAIKSYNRLARVLVEYEMVFLRIWNQQVEQAKAGLNSTVLVRHPDTRELHVNLDQTIPQLLRDIQVLSGMGVDVPTHGLVMYAQKYAIMDKYNAVQHLVEEDKRIRGKIPEVFLPLMAPHLERVEEVISPGLTLLRWTSLTLDSFLEAVLKAFKDLELLIDRARDILDLRIEGVLKEIQVTSLCELPDSEPWTVEEFITKTQAICEKTAPILDMKCLKVEKAVNELVDLLLVDLEGDVPSSEGVSGRTSPNIPRSQSKMSSLSVYEEPELRPGEATLQRKRERQTYLKQEAQYIWDSFHHKNLDSLIRCTRSTLEGIKRRMSSPMSLLYGDINEDKRRDFHPAFKVCLALAIPDIILKPGLEDIQAGVGKAIQIIFGVYKNVYRWGQVREEEKPDLVSPSQAAIASHAQLGTPSSITFTLHRASQAQFAASPKRPALKDFFKAVTEHKEIAKLTSGLSTVISSVKMILTKALAQFNKYEELWKVDREKHMQDFLEADPSLSEFEAEIREYERLERMVMEEVSELPVGPLALITDDLKIALAAEAKSWKVIYGRNMNSKYQQLMDKVMDKIEDLSKRLSRPVKDLDDVRQAMATLKEIRENEIYIDSSLGPVEESYGMLAKFQIHVAHEEAEKVDTFRYSWQKLLTLTTEVQSHLIKIQPEFRNTLLTNTQTFKSDALSFYDDYATVGPMVEGIAPKEASERLNIFQSRFDEVWKRYQIYSDGEQLFGLSVTKYGDLERIRKELNLLQKLYGLFNTVMDSIDGYYDILWAEVDIEKINNELLDFQGRCRKLPKALREWQAFNDLKKRIDDFNETCPLLEMMANKAMLERHWLRIEELTSHKFDIESESFALRNIMEAPLLRFREDIEDVCISAVKEKDIDAKLKQVRADWAVQNFSFSNFKTRGELLLRGEETSEIITLMEDSLMVLGSLLSNRYNAPFKNEIQLWVHKLTNSTEIIESWLVVQNLWVYLEAVFVGGDIAKQLPKEAKRFQNIDKSWVKILTKAHEQPNVVQCCVGDETLGQLLPHLLEQLELCQKSLTGYLEKKRLVFPRFFFVSDPALLEILGQASDSHTIQAHLLSAFDNIKRVTFHEKEYDRITHIHSKEPETIELEKPVMAQGNVEVWLGSLLKMSLHSVHCVIKQASVTIEDPNFEMVNFFNSFPAQVGILGIQFFWTRDAEIALNNARTDKKIMGTTDQKFLDMLNALIEVTTQDLKKIDRTKFETLVTIHLHQRDIFHTLVQLRIKSSIDFEWLKQSRFYFQEDTDKTLISITDVNFHYQNEFLGCLERLVITPLTDRCYITLAQALGFSMGGSPAGPAGTGKTETVKDMGRTLGKYVVVFNCSDQMDFRGLGRIYKGLAQSGTWGCFDEFNRIELPVLSVAAQQIAVVLQCKKERKPQFIFTDGDVVSMNTEFGLFLTMNPGYAGRQELPENLKMNFRPIAMMVPDRKIIIRVKLASCGFLENIPLSEKFFTLYKLCEDQLSKQVHYDFGLRNMLSVLRTLGASKRANPQDSEQMTVMQGLRDMNLSKLVDEDEPLFLSLINDLFPGLHMDKATYPELEAAIQEEVKAAGLIHHPAWTLKLIQLFETQRVRHGFMVLGPTGTGKTKCILMLLKAMTDTGVPHKENRMNPKAITASEMFGRLDVATNDWTDGIFSTLWRRTYKVKKGEHVWLVMDGPVDTLWIENLNSVLDDNKTLTLANGDRIPMYPDCKLVFEPDNVDNASPATVSRNGMVYMSSSGLEWRPIFQGWLLHMVAEKKATQQEADILQTLFDESFIDIYRYAIINLEAKMKLLECNYIAQTCHMLEGLLPPKEDTSSLSQPYLEHLYTFAVMWSVGALLELSDRAKMETWIRGNKQLDLPPCQPGSGDTIFEFLVNDSGQWEHWANRVEEYVYPKDSTPLYASILVPNVDNVRTDFLIHTIAKQAKGVLLIGEQGTAKTVIVQGFMGKYNIEEHLSKSLNFSSATQPGHFQRAMESYVDKRVGTTYGPPAGKKLTAFIDDINMPKINDWGDQITNEIVRQLMEMKGFYSLEKPGDFTHIQDVQLVAAMIHPGGGRNDIPSRLKRQFCVFNCTLPSHASIDKIFGLIGLGYFCKERGFSKEVIELVGRLVEVTRILWQHTKVKMLPTPAKFHYVFNLRDLSRIWEGMLHVSSETVAEKKTLLGVWKHECTRVIADRFVNASDKDWFEKCIPRVVEEHIDLQTRQLVPEDPYFVDFLREPPEPTGDEPDDFEYEAPKIYEPIPSLPELEERLGNFQISYNETVRGSGMDLVFFKDAMVHLLKISRIIRTDRGNALLVGVGGSGKQSLTRLASYIANYKTFQIQLSRSYNANNLLEDLKVLYRTTGVQGKGMTFIFTDNEIKDEGFLEYINNVLSSGEVSNLFARDEIDEINSELIPVMKREFPRRPPTPENLYDYFLTRARQNLHVVLCFSPMGEKFRSRSLKFPGLFSGCTMDWFSRWPKDALIAVAQHFVGSFEVIATPETKQNVVQTMGVVQDFVAESCLEYFERYRKSTHVTPKSYLSFLAGYKGIYTEQKKQLDQLAERMNTGLEKLLEASESVAQLSKELVVKEKELAVASVEAEKVLAEVTVKATAAAKVKAEVQKVKDRAQGVADVIAADKAVAEEKLAKAKPALEEAEAALQTIKAADIATVRKLGKPPHLIMRIMDCVLLLFQKRLNPFSQDPERPGPKPSWGESLKMMSQTGFLQALQNFPKDTINDETVELMQPYFSMEDYHLEAAKKVCGNVAGLCSWTKAMASFFAVNKEVLPLKANLAIQEVKFQQASAELAEANALLAEKEKEVAEVQAMYDEAMRKKQALMDDAETCRRKMKAASALIEGLSGEKIRWTEQSKTFKAQINRLVGDVLLASGFLSYCGPFNQDFRALLLDAWKKELKDRQIPCSEKLSLTEMLTDSVTVGEWNLQGLPNDELSVQNGIIVTKATRFPLLIDPQGQAKHWIKNREAGSEMKMTTLNHKYFRSYLEDSLSLGYPLLIEDVEEELDPCLDNVLEKNFIKAGSSLKVKVGDKEVDVMKGFMLYITTKLPNPSYPPEVYARTAIIDFTVTMKGLEDQLLGRVILAEKQELESERVKLIEEVTANKRKMKELEDNLLYRLTSTKGSLVDDESLIEVLRTTKVTAEEVNQALIVAAETELKINTAREEFRPVAARSSVLYFLIMEMSLVNVMYQTSLQQFLGVFDVSLNRSARSPVTAKRVASIVEYLTFAAFKYCLRGLYEEHKFLFTLLLALKIDLQKGHVKHSEFQTLIKGGAALDLKACPSKPAKWITDITWLNLVELSKLPQFSEILHQIGRNDKAWKAWFDTEAPEDNPIPDGYNTLDTFRKLLLVRSWCPDRTTSQALKYISESTGRKYAEGVILNLEEMWEESTVRVPMICFLSMGSDPTNSIDMLSRKHGLTFGSVSMGQGQEVHARRLMQQCQQQGGWALLQNTHLAGLEFLDELLLSVLETENIHENFRIWLTTEVHPKYPINLLQASIKYTFEPPQGVKAGLKRTYTNISPEQLDYSNLPQWKPMLYTVAFLHTTVQERRKFGPLGWNIPYEYNQGDLNASTQYVMNLLDDLDLKAGISWSAVQYMIGEIQYGGRVTDDYDKRLLNTYAKQWFNETIFKPSFNFYKGYSIPLYKTVKEYIESIERLPLVDTPEIFGLHPNADITYQSNTAKQCLDTILSIQPKDSSSGGGETRESIVRRQAGEMLDKLPQDYLPHEVKARLQKMGAIAPMNIFLRQEIDRMQRVITIVRSTLQDLQLAIDGTIIMSENLRDALDCIYDAKVPTIWGKISWDSATIGFWYTELLERDTQFRSWVFDGRPRVFWMTGFFNPQGFVTAMRQEVTRAHKGWALDSVVVHNDVTRMNKDDVTAPPAEGVYVYGLFLDGASWDRKNNRLVEATPKVLFVSLPVVHIYAISIKEAKDPKLYVCPVYKKPRRTDLTYITSLLLRSVQHPDHWVFRGVALLCDTK